MVESDAPCRFWFSEESSLFTPLIWKVAPRVPVPLKLIEEPEEEVGLFCPEVGFSWKPVKVSASVRKLLWLKVGLSRISCWVSRPLISPFVVLMGSSLVVTVTVSPTVGLSVKSARTFWLSSTSTPSRLTEPKPWPVAVTLYLPMGRKVALYEPSSFVVIVRSCPVSTLRIATVAPGRTAPLGSLTVPCTVPVTVCAKTAAPRQRTQAARATKRLIIGPPPNAYMGVLERRRSPAVHPERARHKPASTATLARPLRLAFETFEGMKGISRLFVTLRPTFYRVIAQ